MSYMHFGYDSEVLTNGVLGMDDKDKQLYRIVGRDEIKQAGDLFWHRAQRRWQKTEDAGTRGSVDLSYIRPVDPQPVNPWIKGSDRLPTGEDSSNRGLVDSWDEHTQSPIPLPFNAVQPSYYWRRIDQTPPPAEPTEAEEIEELLLSLDETMTFWLGKAYPSAKIKEKVAAIRAKQESEGRDARS